MENVSINNQFDLSILFSQRAAREKAKAKEQQKRVAKVANFFCCFCVQLIPYFYFFLKNVFSPTGTTAAACPAKTEGSQTSANKGSTCWRKTLIK